MAGKLDFCGAAGFSRGGRRRGQDMSKLNPGFREYVSASGGGGLEGAPHSSMRFLVTRLYVQSGPGQNRSETPWFLHETSFLPQGCWAGGCGMRLSVRGLETSSGVRIAIRPSGESWQVPNGKRDGPLWRGGRIKKQQPAAGPSERVRLVCRGRRAWLLENIRLFEAGGGHG